MAGDWIKLEHATPDKPEVVTMAAQLDIDQDCVVGKLLRLWIWADQNSVDGNAISVTFAFLDRYTFCPGFGKALASVGWIIEQNGVVSMPNFARHNGESAKKRALGRNRAIKARNANSVTKPLQKRDQRREEKNRTQTQGNLSGLPLDRKHAVAMVGETEIPPDFIGDIFESKAATQFVDGAGIPITDWSRYIRARWKKNSAPNGSGRKAATAKPESPWSIKTRIEEIGQQLENATTRDDFYDIRGARLSTDPMNAKGKAHVADLRKRRAELKKQLAGI